MAKELFGNRIEPACAYCRHGRPMVNQQGILCEKKGVMAPYDSCRKYRYAPLKRVPPRQIALPTYDRSEFEL